MKSNFMEIIPLSIILEKYRYENLSETIYINIEIAAL